MSYTNRDDYQQLRSFFQTTYVNGSVTSSNTYSPGLRKSSVSSKVSRKSLRINGKLILRANPCNILKLERELFPYTQTDIFRSNGTEYFSQREFVSNVWPPLTSFNYPGKDDLKDDTARKFYEKAGDFRTNILELYATRAQTVDMVANTARRLAAAARNLRRGRWRDAARHLGIGDYRPRSQKFSERWLEMQYGWLPLLGSLHLLLAVDFPPISRYVSVSKTGSFDYNYVGNRNTTGTYLAGPCRLDRRVTVGAQLTVIDSQLASAAKYGVNNPALLAWELLPYSFVVDWFYSLGPYLEAMCALQGMVVTDGSITVTDYYVGTYGIYAGNNVPNYRRYTGGINYERRKLKVRTLGIPSLPLPRLTSGISPTHALNAIALLAEAFKRH